MKMLILGLAIGLGSCFSLLGQTYQHNEVIAKKVGPVPAVLERRTTVKSNQIGTAYVFEDVPNSNRYSLYWRAAGATEAKRLVSGSDHVLASRQETVLGAISLSNVVWPANNGFVYWLALDLANFAKNLDGVRSVYKTNVTTGETSRIISLGDTYSLKLKRGFSISAKVTNLGWVKPYGGKELSFCSFQDINNVVWQGLFELNASGELIQLVDVPFDFYKNTPIFVRGFVWDGKGVSFIESSNFDDNERLVRYDDQGKTVLFQVGQTIAGESVASWQRSRPTPDPWSDCYSFLYTTTQGLTRSVRFKGTKAIIEIKSEDYGSTGGVSAYTHSSPLAAFGVPVPPGVYLIDDSSQEKRLARGPGASLLPDGQTSGLILLTATPNGCGFSTVEFDKTTLVGMSEFQFLLPCVKQAKRTANAGEVIALTGENFYWPSIDETMVELLDNAGNVLRAVPAEPGSLTQDGQTLKFSVPAVFGVQKLGVRVGKTRGTSVPFSILLPAPPTVIFEVADSLPILLGRSATLRWHVSGADEVFIDGVGMVGADGTASVSPNTTTTYTLTAIGPGGNATAYVTVAVDDSPQITAVTDSAGASGPFTAGQTLILWGQRLCSQTVALDFPADKAGNCQVLVDETIWGGLFFVSPNQVNMTLPANLDVGEHAIKVIDWGLLTETPSVTIKVRGQTS